MAYGIPGVPVRTEANMAKILAKVRQGVPKSTAAMSCGVGKTAFFAWIKDDESFRAMIEEAQADWVAKLVARAEAIAQNEGHKDSAAMTQWLLERRAFQFFARKERTTLGSTGDPDDAAIESATAEVVQATADEGIHELLTRAEAITSILREAAGTGGPTNGHANGADAETPEAVRSSRTNGSTGGIPPSST